jgi:hypothetical protein
VVINEISKTQRKQGREKDKERERKATRQVDAGPPPPGLGDMPSDVQEPGEMDIPLAPSFLNTVDLRSQERDIIRILLNYSDELISIELEEEEEGEKDGDEVETEKVSIEEYILEDLSHERHVRFIDPFCSKVWALYQAAYADERSLKVESLMRHPDHMISAGVAEMLTEKHELHKWEDRKIYPKHEKEQLLEMVDSSLDRFKLRTLLQMIKETQASIKAVQNDPEKLEKTLNKLNKLNILKMKLSERFGTVILSA